MRFWAENKTIWVWVMLTTWVEGDDVNTKMLKTTLWIYSRCFSPIQSMHQMVFDFKWVFFRHIWVKSKVETKAPPFQISLLMLTWHQLWFGFSPFCPTAHFSEMPPPLMLFSVAASPRALFWVYCFYATPGADHAWTRYCFSFLCGWYTTLHHDVGEYEWGDVPGVLLVH